MEYSREISKLEVSVLPDFFLDRLVSVPSLKQLFRRVELKAAAGGGNLRGFSQIERTGETLQIWRMPWHYCRSIRDSTASEMKIHKPRLQSIHATVACESSRVSLATRPPSNSVSETNQ